MLTEDEVNEFKRNNIMVNCRPARAFITKDACLKCQQRAAQSLQRAKPAEELDSMALLCGHCPKSKVKWAPDPVMIKVLDYLPDDAEPITPDQW